MVTVTSQLTEEAVRFGANKKLTINLKMKSSGIIVPLRSLKYSDIFLGLKQPRHILCRAVCLPKKDPHF